MKKPTPDFAGILRTLVDHGVEFIVVGGAGWRREQESMWVDVVDNE